jgi:CheY-like chemotaxis protein
MERCHPRKVPTRPLVLIVESHEDTRALYAIALSGMGFEVIPAGDCAEAYTWAWKAHPDIIVTEVVLPRHDGWELLRDLKDDPRTRDIPVVIVIGNARRLTRERVERERAASCLLKPCLPDALAIELRRVLSNGSTSEHASTSHSREHAADDSRQEEGHRGATNWE